MISEDFNSEYDFIELKSYLCVRYPKQCIQKVINFVAKYCKKYYICTKD